MSHQSVYTSWRSVEIEISAEEITREDTAEMVRLCDIAVSQKFEKLRTVLKNLNVYEHEGALLVNDEFATCPELEEILRAFGLKVTPVECGLRGKNYVVTDEIMDALRVMDPAYRLTGAEFGQNTEEIVRTIEKAAAHVRYDDETRRIVGSLVESGSVTTSGRQEVRVFSRDGTKREVIGRTVADGREDVVRTASRFFDELKDKTGKVNAQMQEGTVSILCSRARKFGYNVQKTRQGGKVQLVLVRNA